ncbi:MlaD family protein [Nocardioides zeae]|uniref:MCE family protein n=1 Tax=Nocardioides zeae TaxID=1457234 RepID=A0A6P0HHV0_9ACTN|nr:MlaD family protein [Nocardioides zeae]NEN77870.1 MCE family protein [Nocardioides zeae]
MSSIARTRTPRRRSLVRKGTVFVVVMAAVLLGLGLKNQIKVALRSGDTITAEFAESYRVVPGKTRVKLAGLQVGVVTAVDHTDDGTARVEMKVDEDAVDTLGSSPSARIVPLTVLGGEYAVELARGGDGSYDGATIPTDRTRLPVELDRVLEALPRDTRTATQSLVGNLEGGLEAGGEPLKQVLRTAPDVLPPAAGTLEALQGTPGEGQLAGLVTDLHGVGVALRSEDAALGSSLDNLAVVSGTLADGSTALAQTVAALPAALDATDAGLAALDSTLQRVDTTVTALRPTLAVLPPLVDVLQPTLVEAEPVLEQAVPLLQDARELVGGLTPVVPTLTSVVDDLRGPVLDRLDGPILAKLGSPWRGEGEYRNSGGGIQADNRFYEEIAYMVVNLDRSSMTQDAQGSLLNFQAGAGPSSVAPLALDEALAALVPGIAGVE